jgi:hypothetical protein
MPVTCTYTALCTSRAVLTFMYTHTVTDADLNAHAEELMAAASEYQLPHFHEKCEMYLCWKVLVSVSCRTLEAFTNNSVSTRSTSRRSS